MAGVTCSARNLLRAIRFACGNPKAGRIDASTPSREDMKSVVTKLSVSTPASSLDSASSFIDASRASWAEMAILDWCCAESIEKVYSSLAWRTKSLNSLAVHAAYTNFASE